MPFHLFGGFLFRLIGLMGFFVDLLLLMIMLMHGRLVVTGVNKTSR
jgi:hypothetical protein